MKLLKKLTPLVLLCLLAFPASASANASAHGGMFTAKYVDGNNLILLTDNAHGAESGIAIKHNLRLYDMTGQPIPFETAQVSFSLNGKQVTTESVQRSDNGDVTVTYTYPKQGSYMLAVSFLDNDKQISKADFPIVIKKGAGDSFFAGFATIQTAIAFAVGIGLASAYFKRAAIRAKLPTNTPVKKPAKPKTRG